MNFPNDIVIKNGDIVGFAVDFDKGQIYTSYNGEWIVGMPELGKTSYKFKNDGRMYFASVVVPRYSTWKANFGSSVFKYQMPKGFKPYNTSLLDKK